MKIGFVDATENGLTLEESVPRAQALVEAGLDGIEVSVGVMELPTDSCGTYVAVDRKRAMEDLLVHRVLAEPGPEAYFRSSAKALRAEVDTKVILVGGMRTTQTMEDVLESGDADFVAMARPFIREPDIARQILEGRTGRVDCTSCNICLMARRAPLPALLAVASSSPSPARNLPSLRRFQASPDTEDSLTGLTRPGLV